MQILSFTELKNYLMPLQDHLLKICNLYSEKVVPYQVALHFLIGDTAYHVLADISMFSLSPAIITAVTMDKTKRSMVYLHYKLEKTGLPTVVSLEEQEHDALLHQIKTKQNINLDLGDVEYKEFH